MGTGPAMRQPRTEAQGGETNEGYSPVGYP